MTRTARKLHEAPFRLGLKVRYQGHGWQCGDGPWVRAGDVGRVVSVVGSMPAATNLVLGYDDNGDPIYDEGSHGYSVVRFHDHLDAQAAVDATTARPDYVRHDEEAG
jgi:hypothetical protein